MTPTPPPTSPSAARVVAGSWYAGPLAERLPTLVEQDAVLARLPGPVRAVLARRPALRAVALVALTRRGDTLVTTNPEPGTRTLLALTGLLRRRNLVLLEYIAHPPSGRGPGSWPPRLAFLGLRRLLLPRAVTAAQVLSRAESEQCARSHHAPADLFRFVAWPTRSSATAPLPPHDPTGTRVLASGRRTDWDTFFAAARGSAWEVTAICTTQDEARVRELADGTATVRVDVPAEEHDRAVLAATVYVVPLRETGASIGQIRIMNAADAGVPLVVSDVRGVHDYVDGTCVSLVPPGDATALRAAVDALLADPEQQERLRSALFARGGARTMDDYLDDVAELVRTARPR